MFDGQGDPSPDYAIQALHVKITLKKIVANIEVNFSVRKSHYCDVIFIYFNVRKFCKGRNLNQA